MEQKIKGGLGDKLNPKDVNREELKKGIRHEMEHTKDPKIAAEIALDHLAEDPNYYTNMKKAGLDENSPAKPQTPTKPGIKPTPTPVRRPLTPPKPAPKTKPKAEGQILDKVVDRFKKLKK
jgi:hypothetical protein